MNHPVCMSLQLSRLIDADICRLCASSLDMLAATLSTHFPKIRVKLLSGNSQLPPGFGYCAGETGVAVK